MQVTSVVALHTYMPYSESAPARCLLQSILYCYGNPPLSHCFYPRASCTVMGTFLYPIASYLRSALTLSLNLNSASLLRFGAL